MKKIFLFTAMLIVGLFLLTACGQKPEENRGPVNPGGSSEKVKKEPLKIALDATYRPMEWEENGKIEGFDAELAKALAKEMGREAKLINVPWDSIFDNLYAGQYDLIISAVSINDERKKTMLFSDSYFNSVPLILTRENEKISAAKDLSKKKVAVQEGTTAEEIISKNIPGVLLKSFGAGSDVLNSFASKETDAVVIDAPIVIDFYNTQNDPEYVIVSDDKVFQGEKFGIAANKDKEELIAQVNSALTKIKSNGEYQRIHDKYFKVK